MSRLGLSLVVMAGLAAVLARGAEGPKGGAAANAGPIQSGPGHEMVCSDYSAGRICLVDKDGKVTWEHPAKSVNDFWMLPDGNLLFTTGHGVLEVKRDKTVVFKYESKSEIYACQRLANGNTFTAECNSGRLLEVDPAGKVVKETRILPEGKNGGHSFIRNCRKLENGNFLVTHYGAGYVREYDEAGKVVREIKAPGGPHTAVRLKNGNTLIAVGDQKIKGADGVAAANAKVFEVDKDDKVVWEFTNADLAAQGFAGAPLKFMTGFHRLANGNTVMSNWLGHGQLGKAPHLFEVTPEKKVVWTYSNHKDFKTISSVQVIGADGAH